MAFTFHSCPSFSSLPEASICIVFHPNRFSPFPSPNGPPPNFLLNSEHYQRPHSPLRNIAPPRVRKKHFSIQPRLQAYICLVFNYSLFFLSLFLSRVLLATHLAPLPCCFLSFSPSCSFFAFYVSVSSSTFHLYSSLCSSISPT